MLYQMVIDNAVLLDEVLGSVPSVQNFIKQKIIKRVSAFSHLAYSSPM